ncbi:gametocyte-specific factor 1 isoform X2 [Xyrichtys novacula]|uniref:Gametocyte-specific factor 1 isoform X2 n=1 Tax=Xyrichtys novacula TaxID=13765 RepID=A0AAV1HG75_XYRNO|nr:gametocyte-specific factor 1 isoform X2 [Xyrichtys novacula]
MSETFRFGSTTDPCRISASERAQCADEFDDRRNIDPERLVQCPFDKNHQIRVCRFPYHLIKCRKNHPKLAKELKTCPYNASHLVPKHELMYHTETCEDRVPVHTEKFENGTNGYHQRQVPVSTWVNPNMTEDWDREVDDNAVPFVWGVNSALELKTQTRPSNNLGQSVRTPNTLPW